VKKRIASALGGAVATAALPVGIGMYDWRVLAGAAALGAVGGFFGVNVASKVKQYLPKKQPRRIC